MTLTRCPWCLNDPLNIQYHDEEWGVPTHDDHKLFEMLFLEMMEAGLSWILILRKREHLRAAFDNFDPRAIAVYDAPKIEALLQNENIIRSRKKIEAAIANAQQFLAIQSEFGRFDDYIWSFVNHKPIINRWQSYDEIPGDSPEAIAMSKALKGRGFKFVGPSVCYAFMQSCGMVNDHIVSCFRYDQLTP